MRLPDGPTILEQRLGTARPLRVITVGAGASGLNMARQIEQHMQQVTHVVYEKNADVGGTWFENRYPGCACDIPSHNYQFTWEPNPRWNHFYSPAPEILQYFQRLAHKYELYRFIKLRHQVIGATWDEKACRWTLKIKDLANDRIFEDWCDFMINGSGILNNWKWPDIPGLHSFEGELLHSAAWSEQSDFANKKIAVLGCGSSGVQIVPTLQPTVRELITFIRTPTWITAGFAQNKAGPNGSNFAFSSERKKRFEENPQEYLEYRKEVESELNARFKFAIKDSPEQQEALRFATNEMKTKLGEDSPLIKHMIPTFSVGCRRPTPGNGYLESLGKPNVRVVTDPIREIVPEGIKLVTGEIIDVDVFICATGFDISFCPRYPVIGQNGTSLADQWAERARGYFSIAAPNFPNHFMFLGPNAPIGHGSVLPIVEHAAKYMIRMMHKCQVERLSSVVVRREAAEEFTAFTDAYMLRTAWSSHCRSWFKNGKVDGPVVALHPGSRIHWFHMLEKPRFEDFIWASMDRNRFAYLGNGFSTREEDGKDTTWYFDEPNEGYETITY